MSLVVLANVLLKAGVAGRVFVSWGESGAELLRVTRSQGPNVICVLPFGMQNVVFVLPNDFYFPKCKINFFSLSTGTREVRSLLLILSLIGTFVLLMEISLMGKKEHF